MNRKQQRELKRLSLSFNQGLITHKEFEASKNALLNEANNNKPKKALIFWGSLGVICLTSIYLIFKFSATKPTESERIITELQGVYTKLCNKNGHLRLLKVYPATNDSYVVEIEVDETFQVSNDTNTKDKNLELTRNWTKLVSNPEIQNIARKNNILILSVRQIDKKGALHSIAFAN